MAPTKNSKGQVVVAAKQLIAGSIGVESSDLGQESDVGEVFHARDAN
jgi:hypothetical protein